MRGYGYSDSSDTSVYTQNVLAYKPARTGDGLVGCGCSKTAHVSKNLVPVRSSKSKDTFVLAPGVMADVPMGVSVENGKKMMPEVADPSQPGENLVLVGAVGKSAKSKDAASDMAALQAQINALAAQIRAGSNQAAAQLQDLVEVAGINLDRNCTTGKCYVQGPCNTQAWEKGDVLDALDSRCDDTDCCGCPTFDDISEDYAQDGGAANYCYGTCGKLDSRQGVVGDRPNPLVFGL